MDGSPAAGVDGTVSLDFPTFMVWGANTDVGKTLVSAGLAAAAVRAKVRLANLRRAAIRQTGSVEFSESLLCLMLSHARSRRHTAQCPA